MPLKDIWKDKVDNVDDVKAEDINNIAHSVIENEEEIERLSKEGVDMSKVEGRFKSMFSNALKGAESGSIVALDDVSPLEHPVKVGLRSKNFFYLTADKSITNYGLTMMGSKGASEFVLNGTATADQAFSLTSNIPLKAGTYTVSINGLNANSGNDRIYVNCGGTIVANYIYDGVPKTFTINEDASTFVQLVYANGTVYNNKTVTVQIEEGTTATAYTPHIPENQSVVVKSCGKNLFSLADIQNDAGTASIQGDSVTVVGYYVKALVENLNVGVTYTFSATSQRTGTKGGGCSIVFKDSNNTTLSGALYYADVMNPNHTFTVPAGTVLTQIILYGSGTFDEKTEATYTDIQLECGGTKTAYEPYIEGETVNTTIAEGATLQSIAPNMTVATDTSGVMIEAEYNRDINKAVEKLTNAIISLGGNI